MSFKAYLKEMTQKAGNLSQNLQKTFDYFSKDISDDELKHIGDIDDVQIMRFEKLRTKRAHVPALPQILDFFVKDKDRIGMMIGHNTRMNTNTKLWADGKKFVLEFDEWYIKPEHQRSGLGEKYLYFLKNVLKTPIIFGNVHSIATQEFLKKTSVQKRFKLSWYNPKTGEVEEFSKDHYSITEPSDWQVLIESDTNQVFNQFKSDVPSIKNTYEWLFDSIESL